MGVNLIDRIDFVESVIPWTNAEDGVIANHMENGYPDVDAEIVTAILATNKNTGNPIAY